MKKHFYAADYATKEQVVSAFTEKTARDGFVNSSMYRHALTHKDANDICFERYNASAAAAVSLGFI
jgi:hypothetical protein